MIQLVKLTQTSFVHNDIQGLFGTTVHMPFATVAVHIVAHHVPYVNVTSVPSVLPVQLIRGYCVLNELHDAGWVRVTVPRLKYAIKFLSHETCQSVLVTHHVYQSLHQLKIYPVAALAVTVVHVAL